MASGSTTDDWQLNKSVLESNKYVLENQLFCDVKFVFPGDDEPDNVISAHKFVLITRSPVFCAMFTGPAKDENPEIRIEDVDKESFMDMLRYMYAEEVDLTGYNVLSVLYCAKKYMIPVLEKKCRDYLEKQIDHSNVCVILEQAYVMGEKELEDNCLEILDEQTEDALKSESFTKISPTTVEKILKRETLNVEEIDVYKACVVWADAQCRRHGKEVDDTSRRETLGNLIHLIRFPVMELEEFYKTVCVHKVLTPEEILNITLYIYKLNSHNELTFSKNPRVGTWQDWFFTEAILHSVSQTGGQTVTTPFMITCPSGGMYIYSVYFVDERHRGNLSVKIGNNNTTVRQTNKKHQGLLVYEAVFDQPLSVHSQNRYNITINDSYRQLVATILRGEHVIHFKNIEINMQANKWYNIVGFKIIKSLSKT